MTKNNSPNATTQTVATAGQKAALVRAHCTNGLASFPSGDNITSAEALNCPKENHNVATTKMLRNLHQVFISIAA